MVVAGGARVADRASRIVDEADAIADASGWPGPRAIHGLDAALAAKPRLDLTELAAGAIDLGLVAWERPGQVDPMAERLKEVIADVARGSWWWARVGAASTEPSKCWAPRASRPATR